MATNFFSPSLDSLIRNLFDSGLEADDIIERLEMHDDDKAMVEAVILDWVNAHDDRDHGNEPGDGFDFGMEAY